MNGILYVLRTGCQWKAAPREFGCCPSTLHNYFQEWTEKGVFLRLWKEALWEYDELKGIDWGWQSLDGAMTNVTANPIAPWVIQQLRHAFPDEPVHRFLIFDNDAIFSAEVARSIGGFGIRPRRTALGSPWQNGTAERFVGTVRRELLDHVVVMSEDHLRRLLREYIAYYNAERVHTSITDAPAGRASEVKPSGAAKMIRLPRVGGLHSRYTWRDA